MLKSTSGSQVYEEQQGHEQWLQEQHGVRAGGRGTSCFPPMRCSSWSRVRKGGERGNAKLKRRSHRHHKVRVLQEKLNKYEAKD